ncbi:EamA family transporter [Vibrio mediterranei]|uniref:EamA family transporter n=1 Tax=Vibrio mediterranei TaxID=689 RepID=A0ABX5D6K9_9VIBR|nr:DMT family transporter [Vibrio mediterranei]MCG9660671.1 DMT family transporter [Vibrio mediterranei]MCG9662581.1 DMT family transporter [Vibrio mediterranei]NOI25681.1 EamA family transporter [Vibrio mediterranei]PCD86034.1 EamA family transporter [Vibrio mediterranei]PRQ65227.1 EamA family transporter [Vibrio mediterranei]
MAKTTLTHTPVFYMLSSTLSLSVTGLLTKYLSESFDVTTLAFLRFALPAFLIFSILLFTKIRRPNVAMAKLLVVRALCIGACQLCFIYALNKLSLVESVVLFGTGPIFIAVLEKVIFNIKLHRSTIVALLMTFIGVVMLANNGSGFVIKPELLVGLLAGFFNAGSQLSLYKASKTEMSGLETNAWTFGIASLILLPMVMFSHWPSPQSIFNDNAVNTGVLLALAIMALLIINTQVSRHKAYSTADSNSQLAPLIYSNLAFTALWQFLAFDVDFSYTQLLGLMLIVMTSVITTVLPSQKVIISHKEKSSFAG